MTEPKPGEYRELIDTMKELVPLLARERDPAPPSPSTNANSFTVTLNAGGWATILACAVAVLCLALQMQSQFRQMGIDQKQDADMRDLRREQQRADDYQNMLWRAYPELRESALKSHEERENGKPDRL
ncbi:MAG: hypothetical protein KA763_00525 [Xanthomonadales bacterium]|nr:hypothetical protein [Xanthomonadales bacterium]